jgi:hypothetical protein
MLTFILVLVMVFIGVELLVRFVIDPLASASTKKNKLSKSYSPKFDPTLRLASETMYDGGEIHKQGRELNPEEEHPSTDAGSDSKQ